VSTRLEVRTSGAAATRLRDPRVPTALLVVAGVVIVVNVLVLLLGAWGIGVTTDEPIHVDRLQHWFDQGWYAPSDQLVDGEPDGSLSGLYVYGPVAALVAHIVSVLLGTETWGAVSGAPEAYATRHIAVALFSILGVVAVAAIVRLLLRSWRWALVSAAVLTAIPTWIGHGMFNIKDTPVAAGYTVATLGLVALSRPTVASSRRLRALGAGALGAGTVVLVGTRPGTWVALLLTVGFMLVLTWGVDRLGPGRPGAGERLRARATGAGLGVLAAWVVLVVVYPKVFAAPARLVAAFTDSADYPWNDTIRTAGMTMSMPPPPSYLPLWFGAQTPVVILGLALIGLLCPVVLVLRVRTPGAGADLSLATGQALVSAQGLLLPLGAVLTSAVLYDGTRQVLFVLPALAASATVATWLVARRLDAAGRPIWRMVLAWVLGLSLVVPTVTAARLFPYSYTWFNGVASAFPVDGAWMTDYWSASNREVIPLLPLGDEQACHEWTPDDQLLSCADFAEQAVFWPTRGTGIDTPALGPGEYAQLSFNRGSVVPPPGCTEVAGVQRPLFLRTITMSFTMRCDVPLQPYPAGGIDAGASGRGFLLWGWQEENEPDAAWSDAQHADLGFTLPPSTIGSGAVLTVDAAPVVRDGDAAATLEVLVNGTSVGRFSYGDSATRTLSIPVPSSVLRSLGGDRVVVRLQVPDARAAASGASPEESRTFRVGRVTVAAADGVAASAP
jgi:hypothetical protein